jgi:integral membrane protein (TIGR01906 family)
MKYWFTNIILTLSLVLILIFSPLLYLSTSHSFYQKEIQKPNILNNIDQQEAQEISNQVILYFKDKTTLSEELVGSTAKKHMKDVKLLRNALKYLILISILTFISLTLIIKRNLKRISKIFMTSSIITILLIFLTFIITKISFTNAFTAFHEIFFRNNLWLLNPETDALIRVFSEQFFMDFIYEVGLLSTSFALLIGVLGILFYCTIKKGFCAPVTKF